MEKPWKCGLIARLKPRSKLRLRFVRPEFMSGRFFLGQNFIDWLLSAQGQTAIAAYQINGKQLFFPNAQKKAL